MIYKTLYDYTGWTATDLADRFGAIPLTRVCMDPAPGSAFEGDVIKKHDASKRLFELTDGTLIEKVMGTYESFLAMRIAVALGTYVQEHKLGIVLGADGMLRLSPGLIRIPDVSFISKDRLPSSGLNPDEPIAAIIPNLAVEVISAGNIEREMQTKLAEYFQFGVELVWYVYPQSKSIHVFTSPTESSEETKQVSGGTVLSEFEYSIEELFQKPF